LISQPTLKKETEASEIYDSVSIILIESINQARAEHKPKLLQRGSLTKLAISWRRRRRFEVIRDAN
jgi:hypothetical protein